MPRFSNDFFGADNFFSGGGSGGGGSSSSQWIRVPVALVTVSSTDLIPVGSRILQARFEVTTGYTAGTTISVGISGSTSLFMTTAMITATVISTYVNLLDTSVGASSAALLITIAGGPAVGAGVALVEYATPDT